MKSTFPTDARPSAPDYLAPAPARVWEEIVNSLPADYFRPSDEPILAAYCMASANYRVCADELKRDGLFLVTEAGSKYGHPAHAMMLQIASSLAQLAVKLRLCPSARIAKGEKKPTGLAGGGGRRPWGNQEVA